MVVYGRLNPDLLNSSRSQKHPLYPHLFALYLHFCANNGYNLCFLEAVNVHVQRKFNTIIPKGYITGVFSTEKVEGKTNENVILLNRCSTKLAQEGG